MRVTWHAAKNLANQKKHGVSFEEVKELLTSVEARLDVFDEDHSTEEERIISIGPIQRGLVVVVWTERERDELRVISARLATRKERALYNAYFGTPS